MNAGLTYWIDNIINMKRSNPFLICKRIFRNLLLDLLLVLDFKSIFPWKNCSFYGSFGKLLYHAHNLRISSNRFALKICVSLHWRHSTTTCGSTLLLFYTILSFLKIVFMLCKTHFHQINHWVIIQEPIIILSFIKKNCQEKDFCLKFRKIVYDIGEAMTTVLHLGISPPYRNHNEWKVVH